MTLEDSLRKRVRPRIEPSDEEAGSASSSSSESDYSDPAAVEDVDTTIKVLESAQLEPFTKLRQ